MHQFSFIPQNHLVARDRSGRFFMVDMDARPASGQVWAKAFGACPEITTAAAAIRDGMRVLGGVVGFYSAIGAS